MSYVAGARECCEGTSESAADEEREPAANES
jgi:hypothetical protein